MSPRQVNYYDNRTVFLEGSVELNRDFTLFNVVLQPYLRATARYDLKPLVDTIASGEDVEAAIGRWHGQLRGGVRAQLGPQIQLSVSGGYLTLGIDGVDAWAARALVTARF